MLLDIYSEKVQYLDDEPIKIIFEFTEMTGNEIELSVWHLNSLVLSICQPIIDMEDSAVKICHASQAGEQIHQGVITLPTLPAGGYGIQFKIGRDGVWSNQIGTAVPVVTHNSEKQILRYGFLSDFDQEDMDDEDICSLRKFHINLIQYYDWSYRPHQLVGTASNYQDLMGKSISKNVLVHKIDCAKALGMRSIAYGAVYAAANDFLADHPDWGLLDHSSKPIRFIDCFCIMDISRGCPWHEYIIDQYKQSIMKLDFDGIHMDTYGHPKWAISPSHGKKTIYLEDHLDLLINDVRDCLNPVKPDATLIFNNVGNWPIEKTATAQQDCVYIEVWPPYERYHHISQLIIDGKKFSGGKPVILAAYLAPFRTGTASGAQYAALLLTAIIFGHGGTHLLLGEKDGVLTQGYYVDHSLLNPLQSHSLRKYYDFGVQYQDLLYDNELLDVTMTHSFWDNVEYRCTNVPWSPYGESGKLYLTIRQKPKWRTISMVNLCGCSDDYWNTDKERPLQLENVIFEVMLDGSCPSVWLASPDDDGQPLSLPCQLFETEKGLFARIIVPKIEIWALLVISCEQENNEEVQYG